MKHLMTITLFLATAVLLFAHDDKQPEIKIESIQVADQIYMLTGQGGNIGLAIDDDYTLLIDDQFAPLSEAIQSEIAKLTDKPVMYLLNTHFHFDHTDGNGNFSDSVGVIVAHENVRTKLQEGAVIKAFGKTMEPYPESALPALTYSEKLSIYQSDEEIELLHFANAHTDGDTVVHFKDSNVIHAGDILFSGMYPFIDLGNGGDVHGFIAAQEALLALVDDQTKIIPGHGTLSNKADMARDLAIFKKIVAVVKSELALGKAPEQIATHPTAQGYDASHGQGFLDAKTFIEIICSGLN
jgi:cyclase